MNLAAQPRFRLGVWPTPLHDAPRLREALGGEERCPRLLIKRDDLTGLGLGGNKVRKLEYLVGDALRNGATTLITAGAFQSNHARLTAAAANVAGLRAVLALDGDHANPPVQGNLLLDRLLGAEVRLVSNGAEALDELASEATARGERPYVIPVGGSSPIGALGYVAATLELLGQLAELNENPSRLYYAAGSRGTQSGLALGAAIFRAPYRAIGVIISPGEESKRPKALSNANDAAALLGLDLQLSDNEFGVLDGYMGPGYAQPTAECDEAIRLLARTEAVFLDPVYSGKAMAGLIGEIRAGAIAPSDSVVFLHTGGSPALFAHAARLATL